MRENTPPARPATRSMPSPGAPRPVGGSEIEPPPSFGARIRADFISGMGKVAGKFVILLNIARVLSVDEIALLAQVTTAEAGSGIARNTGA